MRKDLEIDYNTAKDIQLSINFSYIVKYNLKTPTTNLWISQFYLYGIAIKRS